MSARVLVAVCIACALGAALPVGAEQLASPGAHERLEFRARAQSPRGRRLYDEHHRVEMVDGRPAREVVTYRKPGGAVFARKTLRYGRVVTAPEFRFEDRRTGRVESARRVGLNWVVTLREARGEDEEQEVLRLSGVPLVDEGYRMLLQTHFDRLRRGGELVADALVPSRLASYAMRFRGRGLVRRGKGRMLRIQLDMNQALLRLVGPSADLYFDRETGRLRQFVGLANIRDDEGDLQRARIDYLYGE